ncbi:PepSY-associated TM helix domain-containing protein [Allonocardiopsis opalescens]|uniref:Putative iron-regulated membrane protein n=1 Tax=Allonocardiopsis opalescens TaxID=1144618 RepID=A0A2T0Q2N7_9ACTN|nr:PepSY-associated TM helix domain-containing protein [Allonocardiopsis opalescens]PRX98049.1 putative iron-regulated membrane protein [Allonocardiopsis opalescens]
MAVEDVSRVRGAGDGAGADAPVEEGPRSAWQPVRALVLRLHFYAGVLVAPFILVATVTGLLYVWTPQLEQALYDHELHAPVPAGGEPLPLSEQVAAARQAHPEAEPLAVRPAARPGDTTRVLFPVDGPTESHRLAVFVDPHTAEVRGSLLSYGGSGALPVRAWIDLLHRELHLGDAGRLYSELAASWLWVVAAGGVALWIGRARRRARLRRVLLPEPGARGTRRTLSFHGAIGIWLFVGLLFVSATGLTWSQYAGANISTIRTAMDWQTPSVAAELPETAGPAGVDVGADQVLAAANAAGVDGAVELVYPAGDGQGYTVTELGTQWPTQADSVAVAPATGQITDELRFDDHPLMAKLATWGIDAHMGLLFGIPNQLALTAFALGLITVIVLGYTMWWRRRPRPGEGALAAPVPRGVWRPLPRWAKAAAVITAVVVGIVLPLWAASLLVFLAVDLVLSRRARMAHTPD